MHQTISRLLFPCVLGIVACQGQGTSQSTDGGSTVDGAAAATTFAAYKPATAIRHVVVIVEENHTFDSYFGRYCTGAAGVSCTSGPACCEAAPTTQPALIGTQPALALDSLSNYAQDRSHDSVCELAEMNLNGQTYGMDRYVYGGGVGCSAPYNFSLVDPRQRPMTPV